MVDLDSDAGEAVALLAKLRLPGLVVTDRDGRPWSILPASQVVGFLVPSYVEDTPLLAGVIDEAAADRLADRLKGKAVRDVLPRRPPELAMVGADRTILEVAALMARLRCPLVAVMSDDQLIGVITASRLLEFALATRSS